MWQSNFAEPPVLDVALHGQTTISYESLNTLGNLLIASVSVWQIVAHCICDFANHHCDLSPAPSSLGEHGKNGVVNSLRFITKNILAMVMEKNSTIDWLNRYMTFPLRTPVSVQAGDRLRIRFQYRAGDFISVMMDTLQVEVVR